MLSNFVGTTREVRRGAIRLAGLHARFRALLASVLSVPRKGRRACSRVNNRDRGSNGRVVSSSGGCRSREDRYYGDGKKGNVHVGGFRGFGVHNSGKSRIPFIAAFRLHETRLARGHGCLVTSSHRGFGHSGVIAVLLRVVGSAARRHGRSRGNGSPFREDSNGPNALCGGLQGAEGPNAYHASYRTVRSRLSYRSNRRGNAWMSRNSWGGDHRRGVRGKFCRPSGASRGNGNASALPNRRAFPSFPWFSDTV